MSEDEGTLGAAPTLPAGRERHGGGGDRPRSSRRRWPLGIGATLVVLAILFGLLVPALTSSFEKTPRDRIGISYGGGVFEGSHFQRVVSPGHSLFFNGFMDQLYLYPSDQQNYIISKTAGVGAVKSPDSVVAPSRDRVQVEYQAAAYFKLNTDLLQTFHEQLGLKYKAYTSDGWGRLIQDTLRQQIEASLQQETRKYEVASIYADPALLVRIERSVQGVLRTNLEESLGEPFFCAPNFQHGRDCGGVVFDIKKVDVPENVAAAYEENRVSQVKILTRRNEVVQREQEAAGISALNQALSAAGMNYVLLRAIESGKINFWVVPSDSGLTLQGGGGGAAPGVPTPGG